MSINLGTAGWLTQAIQQTLSHETAHAPDSEHLQHEATHAEDKQVDPLQLQKAMQQLSQQSEAISNTLRKAAETGDAIIRNVR